MATPTEAEVNRTDPDYVAYRPESPDSPAARNEAFLVIPTPADTFVAVWTQGAIGDESNQRVVSSRSTDYGETWSEPVTVAGPDSDDSGGDGIASWGIPLVAPSVRPDGGHRIYCFYNKNVGIVDGRVDTTGVLRCRYSDDDGQSWSKSAVEFDIEPAKFSHPEPSVPPNWVAYQPPVRTADDAALLGFMHWASEEYYPDNAGISRQSMGVSALFNTHSAVRFLRFENVFETTDATDLRVRTWPENGHGLQVPHPDRPGASFAQEPSIQPLSDGRLICVMRTLTGEIHFALSENNGRSWDTPRPLCYDPFDVQRPIQNPVAPCPLYRLSDGRYFLVFYNNDGEASGASGPEDMHRTRRPAWFTIGEEVNHPTHPLRFQEPRVLMDNDGISIGPVERTEVATHPSFFEHDGTAYIWYPDRKHFLLGTEITELLNLQVNSHAG